MLFYLTRAFKPRLSALTFSSSYSPSVITQYIKSQKPILACSGTLPSGLIIISLLIFETGSHRTYLTISFPVFLQTQL